MNGFGSGSFFGQQNNTQQGANSSFGGQAQAPATANGFGFGAKRTQSFAGPSTTSGGSTLGSGGGTSLFGQNNAANQTSTGSGLFGSTNTNTGGATGGLFGSKPAASNTPTATTSGGLFGSSNTSGSGTSGGLFGSNTNTSSGGLFGSTNTGNTNTASTNTGGGLFGSTQNQSKPLFGTSSTPSTSGGLFGQSGNQQQPQQQQQQSGGLFGSANNTNTGSGSGIFGGNTSTSNTGSGGLFGSKPSGGLFGGSLGSTNTNPNTNSGGGLFGGSSTTTFGGNAPTSSLFGQSNLQQPQQQQQPLVATIDQASYTLPGVSPSQKLYSSLTVPLKRTAGESDAYDYDHKPATIGGRPRLFASPKPRNASLRSKFTSGLPKEGKASTAGSLNQGQGLVPSQQSISSTTAQGEPRKWINSYDKFVRERPTTLTIRSSGRKPITALLPGPESNAPVSTEPPSIADGNSSVFVNPVAESSMRADLPATNRTEPDVSLFHRQANNMTLVRVNKQAIEEGYYIFPRLEDLASMSKSQLSAVEHLVIGRENYGQLEYPDPVDLSHLENLGDILGTLVVFGPGTVCVYPDEETKEAPGRELNKPCIVTIENAWPRDAKTRQIIKDPEDPRMLKHVKRLRSACEGRNGEFVTFAQGVWVFKVPHFSMWGLPADEMIVDDDDDDDEEAEEEATADAEVGENIVDTAAKPAVRLTSSPILGPKSFGIAGESSAPVQEGIRFSEEEDEAEVEPEEEAEDDVMDDETGENEAPHTWLEQLTHASNGILLAAAGSLQAASAPTSKLDLEDIINPGWKASAAAKAAAAADAAKPHSEGDGGDEKRAIGAYDAKTGTLKLNAVRRFIDREERQDCDLPVLHTNMKFSDIIALSPRYKDLWRLLSILYDKEDNADNIPHQIDYQKLSEWFDNKVKGTETNFQGDALDTIWQLVSRHQIKEAYQRAADSNNTHLSLLVALLGDAKQSGHLKTDAERQLNDWRSNRVTASIPPSIRRIWELAACRIPSGAGFTWAQWLGIHLWYFSDVTLTSVIKSLPSTYSSNKEPELTFLEHYADMKQMRTAVNELDLLNSFYCLQGLYKSKPAAVKADIKFYDNICVKLSESIERAGDATMAVYVALHIMDSKLATKTMREILHNTSTSISLPIDFGVPEQYLDESRAFKVARQGEYQAQAEYLVRAGMFVEAHKVIVANVGPDAVLSGTISNLIDLLASLEKAKGKIRQWEYGGSVYLMYARALSKDSDQYAVLALCNALRYADTPTLKSREAISRIAEWVASTPYAQTNISSANILKMKFDPSQMRIQALQQASRLLL